MSLQELNAIAEKANARKAAKKRRLCVCSGASCLSINAEGVLAGLRKHVADRNLAAEVEVGADLLAHLLGRAHEVAGAPRVERLAPEAARAALDDLRFVLTDEQLR